MKEWTNESGRRELTREDRKEEIRDGLLAKSDRWLWSNRLGKIKRFYLRNEWMNELVDEWMNEWMNELVK